MDDARYAENELRELATAIRETLLDQKESKVERGFYRETQIAMAYNSERIEGCLLTEDQTRSIFETGTVSGRAIRVDDVDETRNHFGELQHAAGPHREDRPGGRSAGGEALRGQGRGAASLKEGPGRLRT